MFCHVFWCRGAFMKQFPRKFPPVDRSRGDPGVPLFLTPLIEKGDIDHGKDNSWLNLTSYCDTLRAAVVWWTEICWCCWPKSRCENCFTTHTRATLLYLLQAQPCVLYKKLSCCIETTQCFVSLNISLSHSRSLEMTLLSRACVSSY